jgi:hypothetical protein
MSTVAPARPRRQAEKSITSIAGLPFDPMMVQLKHCFVDESYQRGEQKALVKQITEDFNPAQAGALILSKRSATSYAIVDGQQRWRGMRNLGKKEWFGIVFTGLSPEEEADLYARLFDRVSMHSADKFKANLRRKDPDAVMIAEILADLELEIGKDATRPEIIAAPGAVMWVLRGCTGSQKVTTRDPELLVMTVEIMKAAWPYMDRTVKGAVMLKGLSQYLKANRNDIDQEKLILRLSHTTPSALWQDAQDAAKGKRKTVTSDKPGWMAHAIGTLYNQDNWKPSR